MGGLYRIEIGGRTFPFSFNHTEYYEMARVLTPEQRARKVQADRDRRAAKKAGVKTGSTVKPAKAAKATPPANLFPPAVKTKAKRKPKAAEVNKGGRPPLDGVEKMDVVSFRCSPAQKEKFHKLGGGTWGRARIDAGTVPAGR